MCRSPQGSDPTHITAVAWPLPSAPAHALIAGAQSRSHRAGPMTAPPGEPAGRRRRSARPRQSVRAAPRYSDRLRRRPLPRERSQQEEAPRRRSGTMKSPVGPARSFRARLERSGQRRHGQGRASVHMRRRVSFETSRYAITLKPWKDSSASPNPAKTSSDHHPRRKCRRAKSRSWACSSAT